MQSDGAHLLGHTELAVGLEVRAPVGWRWAPTVTVRYRWRSNRAIEAQGASQIAVGVGLSRAIETPRLTPVVR